MPKHHGSHRNGRTDWLMTNAMFFGLLTLALVGGCQANPPPSAITPPASNDATMDSNALYWLSCDATVMGELSLVQSNKVHLGDSLKGIRNQYIFAMDPKAKRLFAYSTWDRSLIMDGQVVATGADWIQEEVPGHPTSSHKWMRSISLPSREYMAVSSDQTPATAAIGEMQVLEKGWCGPIAPLIVKQIRFVDGAEDGHN